MSKLKRYYPIIVLLLWTAGCWGFFQFWYPYHFFYQEQNQIFLWSWDYLSTYFDKVGGIAKLTGDFLTQFYYYLFAGATILSLCLLAIGIMLYLALRKLKVMKAVSLVLALTTMTFIAVCHFSVSYRLSSTISILGWCTVGTVLSVSWAGHRKNRPYCAITAVILIPITYLLFGYPYIKRIQKPDFILEQDFAIDNEYRLGNYDKVIETITKSDGWNDHMLLFYNLIWAQRGELPDHLMDFTPNNLGTFEKIGPETPRMTINNMNELYWVLGDMTFTERAAMMTYVFSPENRNVRMIKRLAECNIVSGDTLAANKYLRILSKTFAYREWAKMMEEHVSKGQLPPYYAEKTKLVNSHDTVTTSDNAHFLMMQLLDANPDNTIALDYILCSTLLLKDIENFKRDYDRYCIDTEKPRLKTLYQEALCIWLAGTGAQQDEWQKYIKRQEVMKQFIEYNNQRGNPRFKGTYWYYFDKQKAPEI